ncbi:hypothetical protein RchiOBHm_Chr7g0240651 [Rosa chinensis]|uniref:Uncharacterized protein n=1 Tax=Rosa chinensis TaxID=74649 RepID=A0A2P6PI18_ROSCH|nr:hypothetical protein RchiOBHm_Chr7g0240651 [Rosa chinensis]
MKCYIKNLTRKPKPIWIALMGSFLRVKSPIYTDELVPDYYRRFAYCSVH